MEKMNMDKEEFIDTLKVLWQDAAEDRTSSLEESDFAAAEFYYGKMRGLTTAIELARKTL